MKVCPLCQASFVEGYVYCPHDETPLQAYDLRAALRRRQQNELHLLLPTLSFGQRLLRELAFAWREVRRHPLLFLIALLRGEGSTRQRFYLLQSGAAAAVMAYAAIAIGLIWWGVAYGLPLEQVVQAKPPREFPDEVMILPVMPVTKSEFTRGRHGHLGGSLKKPQDTAGGGSGGNRTPLPASGGATPQAAMKDQIVLPSLPVIKNASLIVPYHVVADSKSVRPTVGQLGIPDAPLAPLSQGKGTDGGLGDKRGTGVGKDGDGAGLRDGNGWNTGGKTPAIGSGGTSGLKHEEGVPMATGSMRPTILYREKARYTEDARAEKVQGAVILLATFTADGRITNIRVLKGLPNGLTQEAIKAAQHIRFNPATRNGVAVTVQARLEYNFSLY